MSGFGKANIDNSYDGPKYFKMRTPDPRKNETETVLVLRLLPSMHSYRDSGQWKFYYGQHYGYAGVNPRDPSKPRARPFGCIQKKNKAKEILERCPKCDQIAQYEAKKKTREDELAKQHGILDEEGRKSPEFYEIKKGDQKYQTFATWLSKHNCDKKFWINAMDRDGNFGMLQLSYTTCEEKLMPLLRKLASGEETGEKVDAFDPSSGIWLKFVRAGKAPRVQDSVGVFEELVEVAPGKKAKIAQAAPMTTDQIAKALKTCKNLAKDVVKFIDVTTMQKLVDCSGDPAEVDAIWPPEDLKKAKATEKETETTKSGADLSPSDENLEVGEDENLAGDIAAPAPKVEVKTEAKTPAPAQAAPQVSEEDAEEAALKAQMEALARRKAEKAAAAKAASAQTTTPGLGASVDNPDDFLAQFSAK
jgi:uncharacterized C2H2 Zn-finger protein